MLEVGVDDSISPDTIRQRVSDAVQADIPEMKLFRIDEVKIVKTISGNYKLSLEEAQRLNLDRLKK